MNRDHLERTEALRRARQGAVPDRCDPVNAGVLGACAFIVALIVLGLPLCAILFAMGGAR